MNSFSGSNIYISPEILGDQVRSISLFSCEVRQRKIEIGTESEMKKRKEKRQRMERRKKRRIYRMEAGWRRRKDACIRFCVDTYYAGAGGRAFVLCGLVGSGDFASPTTHTAGMSDFGNLVVFYINAFIYIYIYRRGGIVDEFF